MHLLVQGQLPDDIEQNMPDKLVIQYPQQFDHSGSGGLRGHSWVSIFTPLKIHDYDW